jgi:hypothetical protein
MHKTIVSAIGTKRARYMMVAATTFAAALAGAPAVAQPPDVVYSFDVISDTLVGEPCPTGVPFRSRIISPR